MSTLTRAGAINVLTLTDKFEAREILRKYIDIANDEYCFSDWLDFTGRIKEEASHNVEFTNARNSSVYQPSVVKTTRAAGAADTAVNTTFYGTSPIPLVGSLAYFPNGVQGLVLSVSAAADPVVSIKPTVAGGIIPAVTADDVIIFPSNAQGEGSLSSSYVPQTPSSQRSNYIQSFTTVIRETDLAMATMLEIPFQGKSYALPKHEYEAMLKHKLDVSNGFFINQKSRTTDANGNEVNITNGLRNSIKTLGGINISTAAANVFNLLTDTEALSNALDAQRAPGSYSVWAGQTIHNAIENNSATNAAFTGGGINYAAYNGKDNVKISIGVNTLTRGGRTFDIMRARFLESQGLFGVAAYANLKREAYFIPNGKMKIQGENTAVDRIRARYLRIQAEAGGDTNRYIIVKEGAFSPNRTNAQRALITSVLSSQGLEVIGEEHFAIMTLQS